jgi:BirA family transcriptional regulator, biotin operon repressor / biotin---[acetyl-CoA-carboxylase] ligase
MSRRFLGPVQTFDEIDSTNRYLADEARAGAPSGLVAIARYQTAGRGRLDRSWEAPAGANLLMSLLLRPSEIVRGEPDEDGPGPHDLTVALSLAASDACRTTAGVDPGLKWPNDLVIEGSLDPQPAKGSPRKDSTIRELKLAGILAELVTDAATPAAVVIGIGLNVGWPRQGALESDLPGATSLARLTERAVDADSLAEAVLDHLDRRITDLLTSGGAGRQAGEYRARCVTLGRLVRVESAGGTFLGTPVDLTGDGQLVVDAHDGSRKVVAAGDVVHLRHAHAVRRSQDP